MKSKSRKRQAFVVALLVCAMLAVGLQHHSSVVAGPGCKCNDNASSESQIAASCCAIQATQKQGCCSESTESTDSPESKPIAKRCLCNPGALTCQCENCECAKNNGSNLPLPAIPTNESTELAPSTFICAVPFVNYPRQGEIKECDFPSSVYEFGALSSQQTCVLLSRFIC